MINNLDSRSLLNLDMMSTFIVMGILGIIAMLYVFRQQSGRKIHYDRIEKEGGSKLLSKDVMRSAYWALQPVAKLLIHFKVTPNMLTGASLFFGFIAGVCLAVGHFGFGAIFAMVSALLDSLDGRVARLRGMTSNAGELFDASVDRYCEFFFIGGLIIHYHQTPILVVLCLFALLGSIMVSYSSAKAQAYQVEVPRGNMRRAERATYLIIGAFLAPISVPFEAAYGLPFKFGTPMVMALGLVAVWANYSAIERLIAVGKAERPKVTDYNDNRTQEEILKSKVDMESELSSDLSQSEKEKNA